MPSPSDILILSNGPGEVTTWVRPVVKALRRALGNDRSQTRISLVLSPCPNATGREVAIARSYPEIDRVQSAAHFFPFLLWGKTAEAWDWRDRGVVLFLGGDQLYPVLIAKRLGYRTVLYGEWDTRWHRWVDRFGVMNANLIDQAPAQYAHKFTVVGDLMAEAGRRNEGERKDEGERKGEGGSMKDEAEGKDEGGSMKGEGKRKDEGVRIKDEAELLFPPSSLIPHPSSLILTPSSLLIGLLPGSKPAKLAQGVPLTLAIAEYMHRQLPETRFMIPLAPTLDLETLARFGDPVQNPIAPYFGDIRAELVWEGDRPILKTDGGVHVELFAEFPAYDLLSQCSLCLTTVGANTAELGSLGVPMIVLLPTQQLDAMRAWDGIPGLLANLPGVGALFARLINGWFLRQDRLLAWPNIWAGRQIVPELIGQLDPKSVAQLALDLLTHAEKLEEIRQQLRQVRGQPGAAEKLSQLVVTTLSD